MRKTSQVTISLSLLFFLLAPSQVFSYWVWSPEAGKFVNPETEVQGTPQELYDQATELYKQKNLKDAAGTLRALLKKYPSAQVAPEAQYRLGVIFEERGDYQRAFRAYRDLLERYPQSERMSEAIEREYRIGNLFLSGRRAKLLGLEILPSGPKAIEIFKHIVAVAPYSTYGDKAQFHLGLAYKRTNQFDEAIQAFQGVIDQFPQSPLVPQAQFQIADTAYLQTVAATRDQRVMDRASKEIDRFLQRYPGSSVSDKAAKLRQEIDEKNAEKNYRIGLFYEKENFLDSAFIYYRDVAQRYTQTRWGSKAKERLQALEKPAEYLKAQEQGMSREKSKLLTELQALGPVDTTKKKDLEWQLKQIEKQEKEIQKSKPETVKRRQAALRQKEKELKEKEKALAKKKKHYAKNFSDDLARAFERWEASLEKERAELAQEKLKIKDWGKSLGVRTTPLLSEWVPFGKEALTPPEQVQQFEADRIAKLADKKKDLIEEKENLYRKYEERLTLQGLVERKDPAYEAERIQLQSGAEEIGSLEKSLQEKEALYKKHFGIPAWQAVWQVPKTVVGRSVDALNPFSVSPRRQWKSKSPNELKVLQSQWQEKLTAQKRLVDSIARAFDQELTRAEERRVSSTVTERETDPAALRHAIKQLEREIRSRYNEIQDRHARKTELLETLEKMIHEKEEVHGLSRGAKVLTAPLRGSYWFWRSFLFGLPERDVKLTQTAKQMSQEGTDREALRAMQEQIELESVLIEARNREIEALTRELDVLRARASLSGGVPLRSLLIKFPYAFVREAIVSANRLVPKKDRKEKLVNELNQETEKLERLKGELAQIDALLEKKPGPGTAPLPETKPAPAVIPDQGTLQSEIQSLQKELALKRESFKYVEEQFGKLRWEKISRGRVKAQTKKLKAIEEKLVRLIAEEQKLVQEEEEALAKRKELAEQFLNQLSDTLFAQDLRTEQKEIKGRIVEIQKLQTSLSEELKRFHPQVSSPRG